MNTAKDYRAIPAHEMPAELRTLGFEITGSEKMLDSLNGIILNLAARVAELEQVLDGGIPPFEASPACGNCGSADVSTSNKNTGESWLCRECGSTCLKEKGRQSEEPVTRLILPLKP